MTASATTVGPTPGFSCAAVSCSTVLIEETTQVVTIANYNPNVWIVAEPFNDTNNDGARQSNEKKLVGWKAELWGPELPLVKPYATATTGNNGLAVFYHNPETGLGTVNEFVVKFTQPDLSDLDWAPTPATAPPGDGAQDVPVTIFVIAGETATAQAGFIQLGTVSALAFHDQDRNGQWDDDFENPIANRNVRLLNWNGKKILDQKATDAEGSAAFQVAAGQRYQLQVLLPNGWTATTPTKARVTSPDDPLQAAIPIDFGQFALNDVTPPPAPVASPAGDRYEEAQLVTLTSESGATIRYTLDGSTPTASSGIVYSQPVFIGAGLTTLKAVAIDEAFNLSGVTTETYDVVVTASSGSESPGVWTMTKGSVISGGADNLGANDGQYIEMRSARKGKAQRVWAIGSATTSYANLISLTVRYDGAASTAGVGRTLFLYNFTTGAWEYVAGGTESTTDTTVTATVAGDPNRFLSPTGEMRIQVKASSATSFILKADLVEFSFTFAATP
jgi:hypothetical protein